MFNYSSAKLELLALKWTATEKFWDYLLGSKFMLYTNNNALACIKTSKLGASQIWCLSKLPLCDFNIQCCSGKTSKATSALSKQSVNLELEIESDSDNNSKDPAVMSYAMVCKTLSIVLWGVKIPYSIKKGSADNYQCSRRGISINLPDSPNIATLLYRPVQFQSSMRCLQLLWLRNRLKILYWDWSYNVYIKGGTKGLSHS